MIVKCANCGTKFRVNENQVPPEGRKVKCSKCKNIFTIKPPETFTEPVEEDIFHLTEDELPSDDSKTLTDKEPSDVSEKSENKKEPKTESDVIDKKDKKLEDDLEKITKKYKKPTKTKKIKKKKGSKMPFVITMAMLIIAIVVGGMFIFMKSKNSVPPFKFNNINGQYYENSKYKKVLVIKGELLNVKNIAYKKIKLKAFIYDNNGKKIKEATCYLGNVFSKEEILHISPEYIKKFVFTDVVLKPNAKLPFMIFVFDLPEMSYSFQVAVESFEKVKM